VHVVLLSGMEARIRAVLSWVSDYFTHGRPQIVVGRPDAYAAGRDATVAPDLLALRQPETLERR